MRTALIIVVLLLGAAAVPAGAQTDTEHGQTIAAHARSVVHDVLTDPTTYAPAAVSEIGKSLDWTSSQRFFAAGYVEDNPFYTVSGYPHDRPVSRATGHGINAEVSLRVLATSVANNVAVGAVSRALAARWPRHGRLIRAASIVERVAFAVGTGYVNSAKNFRQWRRNVHSTCLPPASR